MPIDLEFRFRVITELSTDWQFWVLQDGSVEYVSSACENISGYPPQDLVSGKVRLHDYVFPEDYPMVRGWYAEAAGGGSRRDAVFRIRRKDGTLRWGALSYFPAVDTDGRRHGFRGCIRDITGNMEAQGRIERERDMLDKVVSSLNAGLVIVDRSHRIVWYNTVIADRYGPLESSKGKICYIRFKNKAAECEDCPVTRALAEGRSAIVEHSGVAMPSGEVRDFMNIATPVESPDGTLQECLELIIDISKAKAQQAEKERLRRQLIQAQKMEAIGTLAGGVAHEFNNLLTGILGFTSLLQMQMNPDSIYSGPLMMIEKSARRAADLTGQLLGFARKGGYTLQEVKVNDVVRTVLSIIRPTFDRAIVIAENLAPDAWIVDGDPGQLEQVLLNLCINARDAMPGGGTLTLRTRNVREGEDLPGTPNPVVSCPCVCLSVADTGTGIPSSIKERIFEPFFTTKDPGKGTGMGLSVVYGIVQSHGGSVSVENPREGGSTFRVYLPRKGG